MLLVLDNHGVKRRFKHIFAEERLLRLGHFNVNVWEGPLGRALYILVGPETEIKHVTNYSPHYPSIINTHCFDLVTLSEVTHRGLRRFDLVGKSCVPQLLFYVSYRDVILLKPLLRHD